MTVSQRPVDRVARAREAFVSAVRHSAATDLSFLPQPLEQDGWAGAPDLLRLLHSLVLELQPRHVLEFGSGVSTVVLAHAAADVGGCVVTSVDHDPRFARATADLLSAAPVDPVSLQCAPLVAQVRGGILGPSYLLEDSLLASMAPADLVLVDGPPQVLGGRRTMLPQAVEFAQCGTIILFDDADREGERDALAAWECLLGDAVELHRAPGFVRGLTAVILAAPNTARIRLTAGRS